MLEVANRLISWLGCAKRQRLLDNAERREGGLESPEGGLEPREGGLEPRVQEECETQWLPCRPGIYGVRVCASSDFDSAGIDYYTSFGVSMPPTMTMIAQWISEITPELFGRPRLKGVHGFISSCADPM